MTSEVHADAGSCNADDPASSAAAGPPETQPRSWRVLSSPADTAAEERTPSLRRIVLQLVAAAALVVVVVAIVGAIVSKRIAEQQSIHNAAQVTDVLAQSVIQPALTDPMADSAVAAASLNSIVRGGVLSDSLVRVKLWSPNGTILYSDEPRLVGQRFALDDEAEVSLTTPRTQAGVTDLQRPENTFERSQGKLLEVYRPVWTPGGQPLLLEAYFRYDAVTASSHDLWRGFSGVMLSSLGAVFVLLLPLLWAMSGRIRRARTEREAIMRRAIESSDTERKRIAATLHDGVVQQLAAASFAVAGEAERAAAGGADEQAARLRAAATTVRSSVTGMRSLLVDIYPPSLHSGGLQAGLNDLASTMASPDIDIAVDVDAELAADLPVAEQQAMFRVAQEALRNAVQHSGTERISIVLARDEQLAVLEITDTGDGLDFDAAAVAAEQGHLGIRLMSDVAAGVNGELAVSTEPGQGTAIRLQVTAP